MRFIYLTCLTMFSMSALATQKSYPNVDKIEIESVIGSVSLLASQEESEVKISYKKINEVFFDKLCRIDISTDSGNLRINSHAIKRSDGKHCEIEITVILPEQKTVDVSLAKGNLHAKGAFYKVTTEMGAGNIHFGEHFHNKDYKGFSTKIASLNLGSGEVQLDFDVLPDDVRVSVDVGWGDISLSSQTAPKSGRLSFGQGSGSSEVSLPKGSAFSAEFSSTWGKLTSELPMLKNSEFSIRGSTALGKMRIREQAHPSRP